MGLVFHPVLRSAGRGDLPIPGPSSANESGQNRALPAGRAIGPLTRRCCMAIDWFCNQKRMISVE
jgi:hypothetical protein